MSRNFKENKSGPDIKSWTDLPSGGAAKFLVLQTFFLVVISSWLLGGRLNGVIPWIGFVAHLSLIALPIDRFRNLRLRLMWADPMFRALLATHLLLLWVVWMAPLNASGFIETGFDGVAHYRWGRHFNWLPSALVADRCRDYGILMSGLLVQGMMMWLYFNRFSRIELLLKMIVGNAFVLALTGIIFRLAEVEKLLGLVEAKHSGFFASFHYHNHWTAYSILAMGCCAGIACRVFREFRPADGLRGLDAGIAWLGGLLLLSLSLPMTTARAGVLLLIAFWGYVGLVFLFRWPIIFRGCRFYLDWVVVPVAVLISILTVLGITIFLSAPRLGGEWNKSKMQWDLLQAGEINQLDRERTDSWGDGWRMFRDRPFFGWGFGSHQYLYPIYAPDESARQIKEVGSAKEFAHNDWMQYLAEFGLIGASCLVLVPVLIAWRTRSIWWDIRSPSHWILFAAFLVLLLASFDFPLSNPAVLTLFMVLTCLALKMAWIECKRRET